MNRCSPLLFAPPARQTACALHAAEADRRNLPPHRAAGLRLPYLRRRPPPTLEMPPPSNERDKALPSVCASAHHVFPQHSERRAAGGVPGQAASEKFSFS